MRNSTIFSYAEIRRGKKGNLKHRVSFQGMYVSSSRKSSEAQKQAIIYLKFMEVGKALTHLRAHYLQPEIWVMTIIGSKSLSSLISIEAPRSG